MKQLYIKVLFFIIFAIIKPIAIATGNNSNNLNLSLFSVKVDKTEVSKTNTKGKEANPKKKTLIPKASDKNRTLKAPSLLAPKPLNLGYINTPFSHLLGPDSFMFTITSSKENVNIGEDFELSVRVSWLDFGINNGVRFLPEWYKYTLKVVIPDGFIQTGGNYEDYCTTPVNAENPTATFTIKGHFEFEPKEPTFKVLRGFEGANEKSEFIWKGEKSIGVANKPNSFVYQGISKSSNRIEACGNTGAAGAVSSGGQGVASNDWNIYDLNAKSLCENGIQKTEITGKVKYFGNLTIDSVKVLVHGSSGTDNTFYTINSTKSSHFKSDFLDIIRINNRDCVEFSIKFANTSMTFLPNNTVHPDVVFKTSNNGSYIFAMDSTATINVTLPSIPSVVGTKTIKSGESADISATGCAGVVKWDNSQSGNKISVKPSSTTTYKAKCVLAGGCESDWSSGVTITVCKVDSPTISASPTIINKGGYSTISASGCVGGTISWYNTSKPSNILDYGLSLTVTLDTTTTYKATCTLNGCDSPLSSPVTVNVCNVEAPKVNSPIEYTKNAQATALTATALTGVSLKWYNSAEQLLPTAPIPNTSSVGSTNYFVSQVINGCESNKAKITVNVGDFPPLSNPSISKTDNFCSVTLKANTSESEVNYIWSYSANNANNYEVKSGVNTSSYTTSITGYYKVEISKDNYKSATSNPINISTISKPTSPSTKGSTTINRGERTNISASVCDGGTISWYNALNLSYIISDKLSFDVAPAITTTYYAKCTTNSCESDLSSPVEIKVTQPCDIVKPIITSNRIQLDEQHPFAELTANGCSYTVKWYKSDGNYIADGIKLYNVGVGQYYAKCINRCPDGMVAEINSDHIIINKVSCSTIGFGPTISNNSTGQIGDKNFCSNGTVSLSVSGCYDNSKAKWYDTNGNFIADGSTLVRSINSNQTFAVSCENHCEPSQRLGLETINFTVIPYDQCVSFNPQIINNTPGGVMEFCGNGQFSVSASGCPDGNRVRWWVGIGTVVQGSDYSEKITSTTEARFQCISPATGELIGPQRAIRFIVKSFSDCNYGASIINNTPGQKTVFCTKGWIDLEATGCPNNNLVRWYADGTELFGGIGSTIRGSITRTSKIGVNCINPNDNSEFGWNEITFKVDNSGCDPNNPTIINNTSHGYNKFCKKGWVSLEVDGCPDNTKAKWYKDNTFIKQSAIYKEVINQTAIYKVTCENPLYESSYSEIKFDVLTNGDCYIPSIVNLTPNGQTDFCGSGVLKLMMTGCNTNYPPAFEEHVDGKLGRSIGGTWEMFDGVNTSILNYNATESGYIKVICRTNESQNDYIWASQQIVKFEVNPIPIVSATNTPACVGSQFSLSAVVPNIPINTGDIKFDWTNASNASVGNRQNILLVAENSTPTPYNVKFTNNKGCSATTSTIITNYAKPVVSVSNSSITQCAGTILNLNSNATVGSGKATVQVKLEENLTNVDRSIVLTISGTTNPTPTSVTITQKGKTNATCVTCLNNNITDGQIIGVRDVNQPNQKAIIKIENGCAKAWWYDLNEAVHTDWIPFLKNKLYPDSVLRSCISFYNLNNCVNNKGCNQGNTSGITNFTSAGGITSFEITLPSVNGTWSVTKQTDSDKNWLSFVNAASGSTSIAGGGNLSYSWTKGSTFKSNLQNPSIPNIQAADAGTYKIEVTDIRNCVGSENVNVVVDVLPNATVSNTTPTFFCQGGTVVLSATTGLTSYQWKKDGVNISGATAQTYTANASGTYTVQVTNSKNCTATSNGAATGKVVLVNPKPNLVLTGTSKICYGQNVNILASGATTYAWTGPNSFTSSSANPIINVATTSSSGTYNLVGTSSAGCTSTSTFLVTVLANPVITVTNNSPADGLATGETLNLAYTSNPAITPISHKWTFNTDTVALGTNATQNIANVYEANGGTYKIVIEHDAEKKCKAYGSLLVKIKPFVCKLTAVAEPTCYIETNKRWAKLKVTIKDRTKTWKGSIKVQRVKDVDGNVVPSTEPALINYQWQGLSTTTEELPLKDKILDGIYAITLSEKRSDTDTGPTVSCNPEVLYVTVGCQRKCQKDLQPCLTGDCCGIPATINLNNEIKLEQLIVGDTIKANDFKIIISKVNQVSAGSYTWNIEGISKVPVFDNVFLGLKSDVPVVFNECKELVSGTITTLYNPVNWDKPIQAKAIAKAIYESAKEVIDDIANAIGIKVDMNKDDLTNIAQQLREQAGKDLPKELETKAIEAARKLEEARDDYAKAKAAGNSTAMAAASTKFDEARAEIAALKADTDKYLNMYQNIVQKTLTKMWTTYQNIPEPETPVASSFVEEQAINVGNPLSKATWLTSTDKASILSNFNTVSNANLNRMFKYFVKIHNNNPVGIKELEQKIKVYEKATTNNTNPPFVSISPQQKLSEYIYATMCKTCSTTPDTNEQAMINTTERGFSRYIREIFKNIVYTQAR